VRSAAAGLGAAVALLVLAAVALAVTPAKGLHQGKTSQGRDVDVKVKSDHHIRRVRIDWLAPCDSSASWGTSKKPAGTTVKNPAKQPGDGTFSASGKYDGHRDGAGYAGHFKFKLGGKFTTQSKANGTFDIKVRVTKNGKTVDHCHKNVTWQVS
jgi:hypothetical protein